jgi:chromosome segregation protein
MHFTKLRLAGFKSFVEPTELLIEPGLTGVVGPNGCGKSNLVEALRWVMGENRVKQMRGGEMDDVIFAGTTSRPARNLAEVALHIDNAGRTAPAAYNDQVEFEVVRRIERGQGSAYRVGGRDVRARDVQLLFADAASGSHSPALVSQGRIGAIIQAKPTERRQLLEEAAGITGLHSRRHEAELKLKAAEQNLARLDDVLRTLNDQLQALKKQARQAARYRSMSDLIRRAEALSLHLSWTEATASRQTAAERLAAAETSVAEIAGRAAHAATQLADAQSALPDLRKAEAEAAARLTRLGVAREQLDAEEQRINVALSDISARLAQLAADMERERTQAADAEAALARLAAERAEIESTDIAAADQAREVESELNGVRTDVETLDAELARATEAVAKAEAERASLAREIADLGERAQRLEARLAEAKAERERLEAVATQFDPQLRAAEDKVAAGEAALEAARAEAEAVDGRLRAVQEEEAGAREALRTAEGDLARIDAEAAALTAVLKGAASSQDYTPVLDQITAVAGYEAALGAALGDDLTAPLDASAPVHWSVIDVQGVPPALPPGVEPLSRYVTAPPALARRLAQIGVVETEVQGRDLARLLVQGQRLVSRDGALWRWDGLTARAGAPSASATRLAQRNRLDELTLARSTAAPVLDGARARYAAAQAATRDAQAQERQARETSRRLFAEVSAMRDARAALARQAAAEAARVAGLAEQIERLAQDLADHETRRETASQKLAALPDPSAARDKLVQDRAELGRRRSRLVELESTHDRLAREAEARMRRRADIANESTAWAARLDAARRQIDQLEERTAQATEEQTRLAARPAEIATERATLFEKLNAAEVERQQAADALAVAETAVSGADRHLKDVEIEHGAAREERVRCEAAVQQAEHDLTELAARIRERVDCAPEETLAIGGLEPGDELPGKEQIDARLERLVRERDTMGPVNLRAEQEMQDVEGQVNGLQAEKDDLVQAIARLRQGIASLNREGRERLMAAFETVNKHFQELFVKLFGGGRAHLSLAHPAPPPPPADAAGAVPGQGEGSPVPAEPAAPHREDPLEAGLEVFASPPGKKLQTLSLLSGGEQALTALALLFAVFLTNPAPICVLDEVDAPLDDANVDRFCALLDHISHSTGTRFIVVTHHRLTMARMDRLFGVTMAERGVSQLVSVDLRQAERMRATAQLTA